MAAQHQRIDDRTGVKEHILTDIYALYSMHAHTSYISILQNDGLPSEEKKIAKWVAIMNASYVTSFVVLDLSEMFIEGKAFYTSLNDNEKKCLVSLTKNKK